VVRDLEGLCVTAGVSARRAIVRGRVQGVGFRYFAERAARELGVRGWVRNRPDGTVETLAEGEADAVDRYLDRLRQGPIGSRVDAVEVAEAELGSPQFSSFEITR
jgi:acylphosphatase